MPRDDGIGAAVRRKEDFRFVTGQGSYTDDLNRPGQTYAAFVRSPHAHATLNSVGTAAAAAGMDGVVAVFTGQDLAGRRSERPALRLASALQRWGADGRASAPRAGPRQSPLMWATLSLS